MAQNVKINGVSYTAVPHVEIPLATGGGSAKFFDTTGATAAAADILSGKKAYGPAGEITGTATVPTISQDGSSKVLSIV